MKEAERLAEEEALLLAELETEQRRLEEEQRLQAEIQA